MARLTTREARIRVSSVEPQDVDRDLFALWRHPRLCRHLHLPLQSGCDATLRRMHRRYDSAAFARLVQDIRAQVPAIAITAYYEDFAAAAALEAGFNAYMIKPIKLEELARLVKELTTRTP